MCKVVIGSGDSEPMCKVVGDSGICVVQAKQLVEAIREIMKRDWQVLFHHTYRKGMPVLIGLLIWQCHNRRISLFGELS